MNATMSTKSGRVAVNGISYYYEVRGLGEPLLVLHGGMGSIELFCPDLTALARERQVIAVEMHGHGRTTLGDRPISLIDMADDLAVVLRELGFASVDALGYSLGAGVALRLAIQHPALVRRLVLVSCPFAQRGFYPEMLPMQAAMSAALAETLKPTPLYQAYAAIAPNPEDFPRLLDRMGEYMRQPYDWTDEVRGLVPRTLLVYGDSDMFPLEHIVEFYKLIGGGQRDAGWHREHMAKNRLAILPDLTHYEMASSPQLVATVLPFLAQA